MTVRYSYDLHVHSSASPDAQFKPHEVMRRAAEAGLRGIVLVDHNTTAGWHSATAAATRLGIATLQGIEITAKFSRTDVHILGYGKNLDAAVLRTGLQRTIRGYNDRSREIAKKINEAGVATIDFDRLLERFKDSFVSKPNIAQEIAAQQGIPYPEALRHVERGGQGYVPYGDWAMTPGEAVDLIHRSGGIASLAHPGDFFSRSHDAPETIRALLDELIDSLVKGHRLDAIECRYPRHAQAFTEEMLAVVQRHNLLITGGTDWHGPAFTKDTIMGDSGITQEEYEALIAKVQLRSKEAV